MTIVNQGEADASVTMIVGGGSENSWLRQWRISVQAVNLRICSCWFINIQYLGDVSLGSSIQATQELVVNVSTPTLEHIL
jgi:hypothetical protein